MKYTRLYCTRCNKVIGQEDCRIDIPIRDLAQTIRDHNTVFHDGIVSFSQTKEAGSLK